MAQVEQVQFSSVVATGSLWGFDAVAARLAVPSIEPANRQLYGENPTPGLGLPCPICESTDLVSLSELAAVLTLDPADDRIPDVRIGRTGIVLPDGVQLARWFRVPIPPKFKRSKFHKKANRDGRQHAIVTFASTFSFETVFFTPNLITVLIAVAAGIGAGWRSWSLIKRSALEEDCAIASELNVRKHAYRSRCAAWKRLYYCSDCGMVHDHAGKRSLPWYSMLQLVHYPEQEFHTIDIPDLLYDHQESLFRLEGARTAA
ncbi:MAG: hypothetical protein P4L46_09865 [Fimbriimonas sp.]|nr:hypothetical protein [Fimbriimonas sp.]